MTYGRYTGALLCAALIAMPLASRASTKPDVTLPQLVTSAARVVRGEVVATRVETIALAGGHIATTIYDIQVAEYLKGGGPARLRFRQVGTPEGGPADLGWLAGLPTYAPGHDYVLFLLPESRAGLTSPAGAGDGAFEVVEDRLIALSGAVRDPAGTAHRMRDVASMPYTTLRRAVLTEVGR